MLLLLVASTTSILLTILLLLIPTSKPCILLLLDTTLCRRQRQLLLLLPARPLQLLLPAAASRGHPLRHSLLCMLHPLLVKVVCRMWVDANVALLGVHCAGSVSCAADHSLLQAEGCKQQLQIGEDKRMITR
jgi:hypothetical protein